MNPGELNKRIILQAPTVTRDSYGGETVTWSDVATVWAAVWPKSGREYFAGDKTQAEITAQIRIRYRADVRPNWRVSMGTRVYQIEAVINPEMRGEALDLMVKEAVL